MERYGVKPIPLQAGWETVLQIKAVDGAVVGADPTQLTELAAGGGSVKRYGADPHGISPTYGLGEQGSERGRVTCRVLRTAKRFDDDEHDVPGDDRCGGTVSPDKGPKFFSRRAHMWDDSRNIPVTACRDCTV